MTKLVQRRRDVSYGKEAVLLLHDLLFGARVQPRGRAAGLPLMAQWVIVFPAPLRGPRCRGLSARILNLRLSGGRDTCVGQFQNTRA